jgi:hypothetical protein
VLLLPQLTGCFQSVPATTATVPTGAEVTVGITDRGRVALGESVGLGVRRMSGQVLESTDTTLVLAVNTVEYIDLGIPVRWPGTPVQISRDHVTEIQARQFSRTRTWLAVGLVAAAAVAATAIGLIASGGDPGPGRPDEPREPD